MNDETPQDIINGILELTGITEDELFSPDTTIEPDEAYPDDMRHIFVQQQEGTATPIVRIEVAEEVLRQREERKKGKP